MLRKKPCAIGSHLFPEGGTEQISTAPARSGCKLLISGDQSNYHKESTREKLRTHNLILRNQQLHRDTPRGGSIKFQYSSWWDTPETQGTHIEKLQGGFLHIIKLFRVKYRTFKTIGPQVWYKVCVYWQHHHLITHSLEAYPSILATIMYVSIWITKKCYKKNSRISHCVRVRFENCSAPCFCPCQCYIGLKSWQNWCLCTNNFICARLARELCPKYSSDILCMQLKTIRPPNAPSTSNLSIAHWRLCSYLIQIMRIN